MTNLDDGENNMIDMYLINETRSWPSPRLVWLWLRQGRPRDFPVIVHEGTITATTNDDGTAADHLTISDWSFDQRFMPVGILHTRHLFQELCLRKLADITFPDGHVERKHILLGDEWLYGDDDE